MAEFSWLVLRWSEPGWPSPGTVRFSLQDDGPTTRVVLTLAGVPAPDADAQRSTWRARLTAWQSLWGR